MPNVTHCNCRRDGFEDVLPLPASVPRWKRVAFALLLSGLSICLPARGHTAGLDCPETGPGAVPNLLTDLQAKLVMSGNSVDLANEINDLINKLQIEKPNISYAELTNVMVAAYCPVVANMAGFDGLGEMAPHAPIRYGPAATARRQHVGAGNAHHRQRSTSACGLS